MKQLILTNTTQVALLDDVDFMYLCAWGWQLSAKGYVRNNQYRKKKHTTVYIHLEVLMRMGLQDELLVGDHIDRDPLNNQRNNLRLITKSQDACNRTGFSNNTHGYKGVCLHPCGRWMAHITHRGIARHLGMYSSKKQAALAYNKAAIELNGEFAQLNEVT